MGVDDHCAVLIGGICERSRKRGLYRTSGSECEIEYSKIELWNVGIRRYRGAALFRFPRCVLSQDRCPNAADGPVVSASFPRSMAAIRPLFTVNTWTTSLSERTSPARFLTSWCTLTRVLFPSSSVITSGSTWGSNSPHCRVQ